MMGVRYHCYNYNAVSVPVSTHYVNLQHVPYAQDDIDVAVDQQHKAIRRFELEEVFQCDDYHMYTNHYAGWVLDYKRRKEED